MEQKVYRSEPLMGGLHKGSCVVGVRYISYNSDETLVVFPDGLNLRVQVSTNDVYASGPELELLDAQCHLLLR